MVRQNYVIMPENCRDSSRLATREIFTFCPPASGLHDQHPNPGLPPLLLCYVCRSWRKAALATPQLWRELTVMLEYASVRSHLGGVLPRKKIETLKLWNSRMGALCPSIRDYNRAFISNENTIKFAPFRSLFECSAVLNAEALTLSDFSAQDFVTMFRSLDLKDIVFENLQFLSISLVNHRAENTVQAFSNSLLVPNCEGSTRTVIPTCRMLSPAS